MATWMVPPMLVAIVVSRIAGIPGIVAFTSFFGILIVTTFVWFIVIACCTQQRRSETKSNVNNGT